MKTITAKISGELENLKNVSVCAIGRTTEKKIEIGILTAMWAIETDDYLEALGEVHYSIDMIVVEINNCEIISLK